MQFPRVSLFRSRQQAGGLCRMLVAVLLTATKWGRAWPVWLLWGSFGATTKHFIAHVPTSHAVWRITKPYISRCLGNFESLHLTLCGECTCLFAFHFSLFAPLVLAAIPRCLILLIHVSLCHMSHDVWHAKAAIVEWIFSFSSTPRFSPHRVGGSHGPEGAGGPS